VLPAPVELAAELGTSIGWISPTSGESKVIGVDRDIREDRSQLREALVL
jgi:hypothetical protein